MRWKSEFCFIPFNDFGLENKIDKIVEIYKMIVLRNEKYLFRINSLYRDKHSKFIRPKLN